MLPKHQAVRDNLWKKLVLKVTSTSILESLYLSCHFFQFASNSLQDLQGLKQPKDETDYHFWTQTNWRPNSPLFSLPVLSKTVETKNKKTAVPKNKTHFLKQSIFVLTKYGTKHKRSTCQQYCLTFVMLERFDTYRLPNSNPVLGLDLRMNYLIGIN